MKLWGITNKLLICIQYFYIYWYIFKAREIKMCFSLMEYFISLCVLRYLTEIAVKFPCFEYKWNLNWFPVYIYIICSKVGLQNGHKQLLSCNCHIEISQDNQHTAAYLKKNIPIKCIVQMPQYNCNPRIKLNPCRIYYLTVLFFVGAIGCFNITKSLYTYWNRVAIN